MFSKPYQYLQSFTQTTQNLIIIFQLVYDNHLIGNTYFHPIVFTLKASGNNTLSAKSVKLGKNLKMFKDLLL